MQRLRLTLPKRVSKPPRSLRISWNRGYAEQPTREKKEKLFWNNQYHEDADPTPRRAPIYVGASLIVIGLYYFSRRRVSAETPASTSTKTRQDPATKVEFPTTLRLDGGPPLSLLGCGVRTVSFLGIYVYSVGFYADLRNVSPPANANAEDKIRFLVENTTCALRIVPTRSTSLTHLRDGFLRAVRGRIHAARKTGVLDREQEEALEEPMQQLKALFPNAPLAKHEPLHVFITRPGPFNHPASRALVFPGLGGVNQGTIAKEFFLAYFEGSGISPAMKKDVEETVSRPHWLKLGDKLVDL